MGRMINSKREWRCITCGYTHLRWEGICRGCKEQGTLQEILLNPIKTKPTATVDQKALIRRSKKSERDMAKRMLVADGPDHAFDKIATSTGRIGHITNIRVDGVSKNYVEECKNRILPQWMTEAWILIQQKSVQFKKEALLHLDPPNLPKKFTSEGQEWPMEPIAGITRTRHESLIKSERALQVILRAISEDPDRYQDLIDLYYKSQEPQA
jgi:hypothetical protein